MFAKQRFAPRDNRMRNGQYRSTQIFILKGALAQIVLDARRFSGEDHVRDVLNHGREIVD